MLINAPSKLLYAQGNTQVISFGGLVNIQTGQPLTTVTLVATMIDSNGNPVPGCSGVQLTDPNSDGNYVGSFGDNTFYPPVGTGYKLLIDGGDSVNGFIHFGILVEIVERSQ